MKKYLFLGIIFILLTGCRKTDSIIFKEDYESLNNVSNYVNVSIPSDNPFIPITDSKLVLKIKNKDDMVIFFGSSKSNDSRSLVGELIKVAGNLNIKEIYYLDLENIRDLKEKNEEGNIITSMPGSDSYNELLNILDEYLEDYTINTEKVGKRIYIPSILMIKNKQIESILDLREGDPESLLSTYLEKYSVNTCNANESAC